MIIIRVDPLPANALSPGAGQCDKGAYLIASESSAYYKEHCPNRKDNFFYISKFVLAKDVMAILSNAG